MSLTLHQGDCLEVLRTLPDCSVDSVVTDPPYGLSFMGKRWDYDVPSVDVWRECLRVLKPGGHLLAFAGTRTQHRMACRIEDAGFEIRDMIAWVYGSGFPKSLDVSKAIDKAAGAEREVVGVRHTRTPNAKYGNGAGTNTETLETIPATPGAARWSGWGTALKPAMEPITVARKPLVGTVAENVLAWGTGGLNIDRCRVPHGDGVAGSWGAGSRPGGFGNVGAPRGTSEPCGQFSPAGRWPANLIHDGSGEGVHLFPNFGSRNGLDKAPAFHADTGSAARFFYCAKASKRDRDHGCDHLSAKSAGEVTGGRAEGSAGLDSPRAGAGRGSGSRNHHPTVKPTALMAYLCRLVTPPGGTVLDPFMGSGSTGRGAIVQGFRFIGIEREADYVEIARARIEAARHWTPDPIEREEPEADAQLSFL